MFLLLLLDLNQKRRRFKNGRIPRRY